MPSTLHAVTRSALTTLAAGAAVGAGVAVWAAGIEPHLFTVRRHTLPILPAGHRDIRVLHVSDLHLAAWQKHRMNWVRGLTRLNPDLVVNTGDNFSGQTLTEVLHTFDPLLDTPGVFVLGSNDYFGPRIKNPLRYFQTHDKQAHSKRRPDLPTGELIDGFTHRGWQRLDNREAQFTINDTRISFAGLGDAHIDLDRPSSEHPRFEPTADVRLGVTHAPYIRVLDSLVGAGAQAVFAGHTHGGQIRIPFWGAPVTNCDLPHDKARGLFDYKGAFVEVSAGLGFSIYAPARFACPPEVSLVTLTSSAH